MQEILHSWVLRRVSTLFLILKCAELKRNSPFQLILICAADGFVLIFHGVLTVSVDGGEMLSV